MSLGNVLALPGRPGHRAGAVQARIVIMAAGVSLECSHKDSSEATAAAALQDQAQSEPVLVTGRPGQQALRLPRGRVRLRSKAKFAIFPSPEHRDGLVTFESESPAARSGDSEVSV